MHLRRLILTSLTALLGLTACAPATTADVCRRQEEVGCLRDRTYDQCVTTNQAVVDEYIANGCAAEIQASIDCVLREITSDECTPAFTTCREESETLEACHMR